MLEGCSKLTQRLDVELQREADMDVRTYDVLLHVSEGEDGRRMVDLARAVVMSKSGLTALVDRLEGEGLLERRADPDDRRVTRIGLTEAGARAYSEASARHREIVHRIFMDRITEEEGEVILRAIGRVREGLDGGS